MFVKMKEFERVRRASYGAPVDWRVAWVVGGRVEGFARGVCGRWIVKRAAEAREARKPRVGSMGFILGVRWELWFRRMM